MKQRLSEFWLRHREGRITSSLFFRVSTLQDSSSPHSLVTEIMGYKHKLVGHIPAAIAWGVKNEDVAREMFVAEESIRHDNLTVSKSGLIASTEWLYLGASPDGVVECSCCGKRVLEIKCPTSTVT